ncbi:clathrin light chain [Planoprotostelium fungivorum]|uniref:Clathrin light chain n=1 Tax=Planoprotostelium fungivorum TaxID=1890364 RepID=A0A2P6NIY6_9EUKA|nr:clathrin light chain [Planoprotostelium fungivorum]
MDDFDFTSTSSPAPVSASHDEPFDDADFGSSASYTTPAAGGAFEDDPFSSSETPAAAEQPPAAASPLPTRSFSPEASPVASPIASPAPQRAHEEEPAYNSFAQTSSSYDDSPLSQWQDEHNKYLDEKARKATEKHDKIIEEARSATDAFYKKYDETKAKRKATNRKNQEKTVAERDQMLASAQSSSNTWANVASLVDFKQVPVGRDTSRMKKILLDLKH